MIITVEILLAHSSHSTFYAIFLFCFTATRLKVLQKLQSNKRQVILMVDFRAMLLKTFAWRLMRENSRFHGWWKLVRIYQRKQNYSWTQYSIMRHRPTTCRATITFKLQWFKATFINPWFSLSKQLTKLFGTSLKWISNEWVHNTSLNTRIVVSPSSVCDKWAKIGDRVTQSSRCSCLQVKHVYVDKQTDSTVATVLKQ